MDPRTICTVFALIALSVARAAQTQESPHTFKTNAGLFSQYVYRGLAQTNQRPAVQGGADYSHSSGFYAGTWLSNVSWFSDTNAGNSNSLEWDLYAGFKRSWGNGYFADVGYLRYEYPGNYPLVPAGTVEPHTSEAYATIGWKWVGVKYSYAVSDLFGVEDSEGSDYLEVDVTLPINEELSVVAHAGRQSFRGASTAAIAAGTTNDALYAYDDYRLTLNYVLAPAWTALATFTTTNAEDAGYTVLGKNIGDDQVLVGVTCSF